MTEIFKSKRRRKKDYLFPWIFDPKQGVLIAEDKGVPVTVKSGEILTVKYEIFFGEAKHGTD